LEIFAERLDHSPIVRELDAARLASLRREPCRARLRPVFVEEGDLSDPVRSVVAAAPGRVGAAISVVTTLGYGGFLVGPVIVGGLMELLDPRATVRGRSPRRGPRSSPSLSAWRLATDG
jgi:hypothetical protein